MKAEQLRKSILQLAIQGKLVPQDPNDEPASVLLERIRAEKQRLIKEGKIKKDKNDSVIFKGDDNRYYEKVGNNTPVCIDDEVSEFDLPEGWEFAKISTLLNIQTGASFKKESATTNQKLVRVLRGGNILNGSYHFFDNDIFLDNNLVPDSILLWRNDLITPAVTSIENIGKIARVEQTYNNVTAGGFVFILRPYCQIDELSKYLLYALQSSYFNKQLKAITKKSGQAFYNLGKERLLQLILPIPPLAEQVRIVAEIEKFEPLIAAYDKLEQQATKLDDEIYDKLKKSILQYAIQGKLVPQDPNDEPASVLLESIRAEKKAKLGKKYVDSYIYKGDDNCYYEHIAGKANDALVEVPFDIPDNWTWSRIDGVAFLQSGKPFEELESGTPYVKVSDMNLSENNIEITTSQHYCKATSRDIIPASSIIFPKRGGAISTNKKRKVLSFNCCIDLNTMCMTPFLPQMLGYLFSWFLTIDLGMMHDGTSVPQINNVDIYPLLVPIPPLAEQKRIVAKINEIFAML